MKKSRKVVAILLATGFFALSVGSMVFAEERSVKGFGNIEYSSQDGRNAVHIFQEDFKYLEREIADLKNQFYE